MITANIYEAKTNLSKLVERVLAGEEIILCRAGKPVAKLVPYQVPRPPRSGGQWRGQVRIADDFDELPEQLSTFFSGDKP